MTFLRRSRRSALCLISFQCRSSSRSVGSSSSGLLETGNAISRSSKRHPKEEAAVQSRRKRKDGHSEAGSLELDRMQGSSDERSMSNFVSLLQKFAKSKSLSEGRRVHSHLVKLGLDQNPFLRNNLAQMYASCESLDEARAVFDSIATPNAFSWNVMVAAYAQSGQLQEARQLFDRMPDKNVVSWTTMVTAYAKAGQQQEAKSMFDSMPVRNTISWNAMIALYAQNGHLQEAKSMFDEMPNPNVVSNNVMITGLGYNGRVEEAKRLFDGMTERTTVSWNAMITAYCQNADLEEARKMFDEMPDRSVVSWNTMIAGYAQNGHSTEALELFKVMDSEGMQPSKLTFCSVLDACASLSAAAEGKLIHADIEKSGLLGDLSLGNALTNMYGKCGKVELARKTFDEMTHRNVVSWTGMVAAYAQNGYSVEALEFFRTMVLMGVEPNEITLINTLSACGHGGLYEDGCQCFSSLTSGDYGVSANTHHFLCMIDLLGRAGQLDAAEALLTKMPFTAGVVAWTSLLSACRTHQDMKRAGRVAKRIFELDTKETKDPAPYVMLSNIYAAGGNKQEEMKARDEMKIKCGKKQPGLSSIKIKGKVHDFYSLDSTHPQRDAVYSELRRLNEQMDEAGYVPETKKAAEEEEETEHVLNYHSEKLAVTYGIMSTPAGAPLCIIKNLRVCSDCHAAIKFISKLVHRKIAVRDPTRFHHFEHGICSCGDYW